MKGLVRERRADQLPEHVKQRAVAGWREGKSIAWIRQLVGAMTDGGAYRVLKDLGCGKRDKKLSVRLQGNKRSGAPATDVDPQPIVRQVTPERRCGRCHGYTDSDPCHRCGAPYAAQRSA